MPISAEFLGYVGSIIALTATLKRVLSIPWILSILKLSHIGGGIALALTAISGIAAGLVQYGADGVISYQEAVLIIEGIIGAAGVYSAAVSVVGFGTKKKEDK